MDILHTLVKLSAHGVREIIATDEFITTEMVMKSALSAEVLEANTPEELKVKALPLVVKVQIDASRIDVKDLRARIKEQQPLATRINRYQI